MPFWIVHVGVGPNGISTRDSLIKPVTVISQHVTSVSPAAGLQILGIANLGLGSPQQQDCIDSNITAITPHLAFLPWTNCLCKMMSTKTNYVREDIKEENANWTIKAPYVGKKEKGERGWFGCASERCCRGATELCDEVIKWKGPRL